MMEDVIAAELEDGELSDVEYTPLPRPTLDVSNVIKSSGVNSWASTNATSIADNSDNDDQDSTDSDDSDGPKRPKAPRMRLNLLPVKSSVPKKYSIWSQDLQAEALNEQLLKCDVDQDCAYDKSRNVESYNYISHVKTQFEDGVYDRKGEPMGESSSNKRRYKDRGNIKSRLGRRTSPDNDIKGPSRSILALKVTEADSPEIIATDIANKLYEEKESLILKTIQNLGAQKAISLFDKTRDIEEDGGMMILNGCRRRTPGGVFLYLLRVDSDVTSEQKDSIFGEENKAFTSKRKADRAHQRREKSKSRVEALKRKDLESSKLPELGTRAELVVKQMTEGSTEGTAGSEDVDGLDKEEEEFDATGRCGEESVCNPPPSPATDNRENSSDGVPEIAERKVMSYDDDFLDIGNDDMDVF